MDQGPLVMQQIDAGAKLVADFNKHTPLQAAFWLKDSEEKEWFLYLASDQINDSNAYEAYGDLLRVVGPGLQMELDLFQVKLIGSDTRLAKEVIAIQNKYPSPRATRLRNRMLGGNSVDEVYVYPIPVLTPV